jgi:hypothetical protein
MVNLDLVKNRVYGRTAVIDTSFILSSQDNLFNGIGLVDYLYTGMNSIDNLDEGFSRSLLEGVSSLEELFSLTDCVIIPEVKKELLSGLSSLNKQSQFYELYAKKRTEFSQSLNQDDSRLNKLEELRRFCSAYFDFIKSLKIYHAPKEIDAVRKTFIEVCRENSKGLVSSSEKKKHLRNPTFYGDKLETDFNIVATAFCLAYRGQSVIVSNDSDLTFLSSSLSNFLKSKSKRKPEFLPDFSVSVYNSRFEHYKNVYRQ